jgi:hypothetical protein
MPRSVTKHKANGVKQAWSIKNYRYVWDVSWTRKVTSRAHLGAYTRPHRTDPRVLPSRSVSIMAFQFCRDDATRESYLAIVSALFDCFNAKNLRVVQFFTNMNSLPMVVTSTNKSYFTFFIFLGNWNFVGCATSAPDGSSPRGYSRKFFEYRLK